MSHRDMQDGWRRSLAQAVGFAQEGALDEAVARALDVFRATTRALADVAPADDAERAAIRGYLDQSTFELTRLRKLEAVARARVEARCSNHRERERQESRTPFAARS